jgi:hypothetical protein
MHRRHDAGDALGPHTGDPHALAEGKAAELERYIEIYDPKTFTTAVTALFEQRAVEFTD